MRRALIWPSAVLLLLSLRAQNSSDSPSITIRSSVRLVQVDVIAKDRHGNPVPRLEAKDFTLLDDGVREKISRISVERGAEEHRSGQSTGPQELGPRVFSNTHPDNVVPTVILFDVLNTPIEDQPSMGERAFANPESHERRNSGGSADSASGEDLATNNLKANLRLTADEYQKAVSEGVLFATDLKLDLAATEVRVMARDESSRKIGTVDVPVDPTVAQQPSR